MSEENTTYRTFLVRSHPNSNDAGGTWSGYPPWGHGEAWAGTDEKGLPALYSKSKQHLQQMIDAVMDLPEEERAKTVDEWNQYLKEKGLVK
jgi:hypothetical protein